MKIKKRIPIRGTKTKKINQKRTKQYPVYYLAVIIAILLIVEGIVFGSAGPKDWHSAVQLLDISQGVRETQQDLAATFQPMADLAADVDEFYRLATVEMMSFLDLSESYEDATILFVGIDEFYRRASIEMAKLLDVSGAVQMSSVAGISITK